MSRAAVRYAKAVLDLTEESKTSDVVNNDMQDITNTISKSNDLQILLQSSTIKNEQKKKALLKVFPNLNSATKSLLDLLVSNKRISILNAIASKYQELYDKSQGIVEATVTTAIPLTKDIEAKVLAKVKEYTGSDKAVITNIIDESIVGGFILRVNDLQYDASIANQFNKLKREFTLN